MEHHHHYHHHRINHLYHRLHLHDHPPPPPSSRVPPISPHFSSDHHRHHHHHQPPEILYDDRPPMMIQVRDVDRLRFDFLEPRVSPYSPIFVDKFSSPMYTDEFDVDCRFRYDENWRNFDRDELHGVRFDDDRRFELRRNVEYDNWRSMNDFEREELLYRRIDERRRVTDDLERVEFLRHRVYDRIGDERRLVNYGDVDSLRPIRDEDVHMPLNFDVGSDVVHLPFEFRARKIEGEERVFEFNGEQRDYERERRERVKAREGLERCYDHTKEKYLSRKKSTFLRLQPSAPHTSTSRTTSSPHKVKGNDVGSLDRKLSEERVESPVDVDVSFKANALVTKVVGAPSSSEVDSKIVGESPSRARLSRNRGTNSPVSKKEDKQSVKVGIRKVAEVPDVSSRSSLSSSGRSSLSAGGSPCSMASLGREVDKKYGFFKASSPGDKRKRKAVNLISCFSASVPTNLDTGIDVDNAVSSPSGGMSDAPELPKPRCVQDQPHISTLDDVIKSVEKSSTEKCMDSRDLLVTTNYITCDINVYKPRKLSSKHDTIGELKSLYSQRGDDNDDDNESSKHTVDERKSLYSQRGDVSDGDILSADCMKITTIPPDIEVTNGIQEQKSTCAGSVLVDDESRKRRKLSQEGSSAKGDVFSLDVRKRKIGNDVCDVDPKDNLCNCSKKRKSNQLDSVFAESCDFCSSANTLKSLPSGHLFSVNYSEQAVGMQKSSDSLPPPEDVVGETTNSLLTVLSALGDCPKEELQQKDSHSSGDEIVQSSYAVESTDNKEDDEDLIGGFKCLENELSSSDSEAELTIICRDSEVRCIRPNNDRDVNDEPLVTDMECESNITVECNLATQSDRPLLCAESTREVAFSKPVVLNESSKMNSLPVFSQVTTSDDIICRDDKKIESLKSMRALIEQSNIVCGKLQKNVKHVNIAAPSNLPKAALNPSKYPNKGVFVSSPMSRQFSWRNEVTLGKTTISSPQANPVATFSKKSLAAIPAKPRTWHRTLAASNTIVKKPSSSTIPPQRPPYGKSLKVQDTSYVRKGNSLVRNSASSTTTLGPHASSVSIIQEKPIDINGNGKVKCTGGHHETLKRSPLLCAKKTSSDSKNAYTGDGKSQVEPSGGMKDKVAFKTTGNATSLFGNSEIVSDRSFVDAGNLSDGAVHASEVKKVVYIKRKANQLIAASTSPEVSFCNMDNKLGLSSDNSYYKKRKHQLIRASSESNIQKMVSTADDSSNLRAQRACNVYSRKSGSKGPSNRVKSLKASLVWKLGDAKSSAKGSQPLRSKQLLSQLLPWKRTTYRRTVWRASASSSDCSTLIKTRKLATSRNQAVLYVRSGRGFSLRRSKVISLAGSLKWSKSMEKRSKKIDAEATLAVAESDSTTRRETGPSGVSSETENKRPPHKSAHSLKLHRGERIFRVGLFRYRMDPSRRTLQRISDEEAPESTTSKTEKYVNKSYMPKRLLIGSDEYVRVGNGNQLVRDPKRRTRILASEKVRWSLHTARLRLAKKRKFCQFFTRFGRCNKSEGKCPYIHDSSKITVCTKFLKGLCVDPNCKLTHKVIPDRMPDCSFFLQGSCSNESCPYRHVNVNPKASICESFSRGYCSEGNKCQKKHSYLCPEFEATGSCPQGSKCKLYHPKKNTSKKGKTSEDQRNIKGRYFDPELTATVTETETEKETTILEKDATPKNSAVVSEGGDLGDYISLDVSDDEVEDSVYPTNDSTYMSEFAAAMNGDGLSGGDLADYINLDNEARENKCVNKEVMYLSEFDALNCFSEDGDDEQTKPLGILETESQDF